MTTRGWLDEMHDIAAAHGRAVRIVVAEVEGSTPREAGAAMTVLRDRTIGTIGGGELEHQTIARARALLDVPAAEQWPRDVWSVPLGPALGQCCGGRVTLLAELFAASGPIAQPGFPGEESAEQDGLVVRPVSSSVAPLIVRHRKTTGNWPVRVQRVLDDMLAGARPRETVLIRTGRDSAPWLVEPAGAARTRLMLYGAGHVGRALVHVLADLPFDVTWIDTAENRFPERIGAGVRRCIASHPEDIAADAPAGAWHLVMTFSHPLDLAICHAVLQRGDAGYLGLIGSATKRARLVARLAPLGHASEHIARQLHCPIGLPDLPGKAPAVIAVSVAADLVRRRIGQAAASQEIRSGTG